MRTGNNERKSSSSSSPPLDCDVGLGFKMMQTESYLCDVGGGGPLFSYSSSRVADCAADRTSDNTLPGFFRYSSFGASGGKALFTEPQWRELERQNAIHRYILASIPVPPQLLHPSPPGSDSRFGSSDPEPWRCKRTDGKKWRCSRDVAPEQKYCERHALKTKPRSRKHLEIASPAAPPHPFQRSTSRIDQTRSIEWFLRGANAKHQQQQQPRSEPDNQRQGFYTSTLQMDSSPQMTTRHLFVDAWEKDDMGMSSKMKKLSPSASLSLSMCGNGRDNGGIGYDDVENRHSGIGMMSSSWISSPPGGPLGEALCLGGNAGKNTSNTSKSSCEDGSHFVGRP